MNIKFQAFIVVEGTRKQAPWHVIELQFLRCSARSYGSVKWRHAERRAGLNA